jgi:lipocalin
VIEILCLFASGAQRNERKDTQISKKNKKNKEKKRKKKKKKGKTYKISPNKLMLKSSYQRREVSDYDVVTLE